MKEQDKAAFEAARKKARMAHPYNFDSFDFRSGWQAALEYARSQPAQEPVATVKVRPLQGHESKPSFEIIWTKGKILPGPLYTAPPAAAINEQLMEALKDLLQHTGVEGWYANKAEEAIATAEKLKGESE